mmetsp:Transcript_2003/g.3154  ORF Transcript_2003/g.3154 Transcript_2003/m.3154 type:complete len:282 (+) Transcript_2003:85-930(+)|eukprot:CAMPEP_0174956188 /NCGR_PEP_ID=MMETSP0004_2-20121128/1390_1 /TAXON_ID=420556 /ORGANISM="Ochromonas sp., Strain CCMP1393" /LENGTH=281 /DNA_ID=CAMNT_0016204183 /DNA_START=85 /DNA_END=933 /DNA_ORIENTATION=+
MKKVFSHGSNSIAQLRARVENPNLVAMPAKVDHWERIFCVRAVAWGGAAASLYPQKEAKTFGAVVSLSDEELRKLDAFEGGYKKEEMGISIWENGNWVEDKAIAYIAKNPSWSTHPSETYLTAIHVMLREQFAMIHPECVNEINISGVFNDTTEQVQRISKWQYPGSFGLSLKALCVEVNARKSDKWIMPRTMREVMAEFELIGVRSAAQLAALLTTGWTLDALDPTVRKDLLHLNPEALSIFRELLDVPSMQRLSNSATLPVTTKDNIAVSSTAAAIGNS